MIDILRAAAGIWAVLAPIGLIAAYLALPRDPESEDTVPGGKTLAYAAAVTLAVLLVTVLLADPFLDVLDVVPESFQAGAAVIMLPLAIQLLWTGRSMEPGKRLTSRPWLVPLTFTGLVGPASLAAVLAYTARYGEGETAAAVALGTIAAVLVLSASGWLEERLGNAVLGVLGRLSGALVVVIALELVVDGVRSV